MKHKGHGCMRRLEIIGLTVWNRRGPFMVFDSRIQIRDLFSKLCYKINFNMDGSLDSVERPLRNGVYKISVEKWERK